MEKLLKGIKYVSNLVAGYFLIPAAYLGFLLATNSSKGWNVQNKDGLLFVPIGVLLLIAAVLTVGLQVANTFFLKKKFSKHLSIAFYAAGIVAYLLHWCLLK